MNSSVYIAVNNQDGSVVVSHSGAEVGQGIDTKLAQVWAFE
jgi:xanthine dehydrogenase molybdopterin-binding subunit B